MKDQRKTKDQLVAELAELRRRIAELEASDTARKRAEKALQESEEKLRTVIENVNDVIFQLSPTGLIQYVSPGVKELWGYNPEDLIGKHLKKTTPMSEVPKALEALKRAFLGKASKNFEIYQLDSNGKLILTEINITPVKKGGKIIAVQGVMRNIAERKRAEEERNAFARLGTRLAASASVESMISIVREETDRLLKWDAHYFAVRRPEEDTFHVVSFVDTVGTQKKTFPKDYWPAHKLSPSLRQLLEGRPVLTNRTPGDQEPVLSRFGDKDRTSASMIHVAVRSGDNVIGILSVQSYTSDRYDEGDVETLQRIADAIAPALERAYAEQALRESEEKYRTLIDNVHIGVYRSTGDPHGRFLQANPAMAKIHGYDSVEEFMKLSVSQLYENPAEWNLFLEQLLRQGVVKDKEFRLVKKDGTPIWASCTARVEYDADGRIKWIDGVTDDITERKRAEQQLAYAATHDALTGLPNRLLFNDRFTLELAHARRDQQMAAVMLLDLDHFKDVNDTLGHSEGDKLLKAVAGRLTNLVRQSDTVARMGGDEFMLLLPKIASMEDAANVAQKILKAFGEPFVFDGRQLHITTSIGIAFYPNDGEDADTLMKNADIAMYLAKERGRNNYQRYSGREGGDSRQREHPAP